MNNLPEHKQLILFDGVCNLCNSSINYIIKHDKKNVFMFAPLQGKTGKEVIINHKIDTSKTDSILLFTIEKGVVMKSSAAIAIASKLGFPRNLLTLFYIIPPFIRNWVYDYIAKNRYKWYGKKDKCMVPTQELKSKFLE
ncbi:thiol-disulfide oxidoreductase [Flavobacteriales bacterium 34_180_T64]|nr:thiol-disulfide oxidoreductase [Flavobacteriales bacterium 34_180_T64]